RPRESRVQATEWGAMDWLVDDAMVENAGLSVARMTLERDACSPGHRHPDCNEVIHLIEGSVEQTVDRHRHVMEPGDTVFVPAGAHHRSRNIGPGAAVVIVSYSAGTRIYEAAAE
ncbi:MAG: cupin domain-containing protein, partial [Rhodospirillales bacterium]|nr:cupin domain-containing protein [Rhodospirillales bacterium]